ncbi:MAG: hypothetical protein JHC22_01695, partial [Thermoproteus sp.]|nr:hypothetical protein [Thermoproteus sp.]
MEAARASIAGHLLLALRALSEAHVARTTGHGTSGFFLFASSFGTSPLSLSSLLFTSLRSHHTPFTHPVGVVFHSTFNTAAASLSTAWPCGQRSRCQS